MGDAAAALLCTHPFGEAHGRVGVGSSMVPAGGEEECGGGDDGGPPVVGERDGGERDGHRTHAEECSGRGCWAAEGEMHRRPAQSGAVGPSGGNAPARALFWAGFFSHISLEISFLLLFLALSIFLFFLISYLSSSWDTVNG